MTVTAFDGTQLQAVTLNHQKPMVLKEEAPEEGYADHQIREMKKRQYCPVYQAVLTQHYRELKSPEILGNSLAHIDMVLTSLLSLTPFCACSALALCMLVRGEK